MKEVRMSVKGKRESHEIRMVNTEGSTVENLIGIYGENMNRSFCFPKRS